MIKSIKIVGFKAFASQIINLGQVTLLCGRNNSGKSSVLQALRMYCNSAEGESPMIIGLGSLKDIRSKFALPADNIVVSCTFQDDSSSELILSESKHLRPTFAPVTLSLSAERFGPRVSLPLDSDSKERPFIGFQGEHVLGFLDDLRNCIVHPNLRHEVSQGDTLEYQCAAWLSEIAPGTNFYFEVVPDTDSSRMTFDSFRPTNVGFGLSYSLPVVTAILGASSKNLDHKPWENAWDETWDRARNERGTLLIIENPEAHLHPSAQTAMGRLIAKAGRSGLQIVVETQSEHIMDGVRLEEKERVQTEVLGFNQTEAPSANTNIAAPVMQPVVFNYFSRTENGHIAIESPSLLENGKLSHWPSGFFDQALKNRIQLAK